VPYEPLSEDEREIRDLVRQLARERIAPRAAEIDESHEFPWDVVELFRENDLFGLFFDEEFGGLGTGTLLALVAIEEVSKVCATSGLILAVQELGSLGLKLAGNEAASRVRGVALCICAHRVRLGVRLGGHALDGTARG
jgi:alkylation response protein AidB-like acyl-CoA dehydrogenase